MRNARAKREINLAVSVIVLAALLYEGWIVAGTIASASQWAAQARTTATQIANGHAFDKHVVKSGEFPGVTTREEFAAHVSRIIKKRAEVRTLNRERAAYWDDPSGTIVIVNPRHPDGGTAFRPMPGKQYFLDLERGAP